MGKKSHALSKKATNLGSNGKENEELLHNFSKNLHQVIQSRDKHHGGPEGSQTKAVTFNSEVIETSFGGTRTPGRIKDKVINPIFGPTVKRLNPIEIDWDSATRQTSGSPQPSIGSKNDTRSATQAKEPGKPAQVPKVVKKTTEHEARGLVGKVVKACAKIPLAERNGQTRKTAPEEMRQETQKVMPGEKYGQDRMAMGDKERRVRDPRQSGHIQQLAEADKICKQTPLRRPSSEQWLSAAATPECFNPVTFETPAKLLQAKRASSKLVFETEDSCGVSVAVRVRPFFQRSVYSLCVLYGLTLQS